MSTRRIVRPVGSDGRHLLADAAIGGLGITDTGRVFGRSAADLADEAVRLAVDDAGMSLSDVDGLLFSNGISGGVGFQLQRDLGLRDLTLLTEVRSGGTTAITQLQRAAIAVATGEASVVVCVHADAPLRQAETSGGEVYRQPHRRDPVGFSALDALGGRWGATVGYALAARRHMERFGTTSEQLGAVAVSQRKWAAMNPRAQFRDPISIDDHQSSRWVVEPLHLLDCCPVSNGAVAVLVTSEARARDLRQPAIHIWGVAHSSPGYPMHRGCDFALVTGAAQAGRAAMSMAGIGVRDVDVCELYDCYTFVTLVTLEDYGFCEKGEGGPFVAGGRLAPGGALAVNTGGGQLSSYYLWGMTPLSEGIIQARGQAGERQVESHDVVLVSGSGGVLDHHATCVLSPKEQS